MFCVTGSDISQAWVASARELLKVPAHAAYHAVTRVEHPDAETPAIRDAIDTALSEITDAQPVETVANTIFPTSIASRSASADELAQRYLEIYPRLRRFNGNRYGTYFGRLVAYPNADGSHVNQLANVIEVLQRERGKPSGAFQVIYELNVSNHPSDHARTRGFPCLSHMGFQLDGDHMHLLAQYRSQLLLARAYGNYLGLGRLLTYVAGRVGSDTGTLSVAAGRLQLDSGCVRRVARIVAPASDS